MLKISAVIPCFNNEHTIQKAIESAKRQSYSLHEIIVIDDSSTDSSVKKIKECSVKLFINKENRGANFCRNFGMQKCSGDLIAFLDADDEWVSDKLEKQVLKFLDHAKNICCFSYAYQINEFNENHILPHRYPRDSENIADYILKDGNIVLTSSLVINNHFENNILFNEKLKRFQDVDYVLRLEKNGFRLVCIPEPLVVWSNSNHKRTSKRNNEHDLTQLFSVVDNLTYYQKIGLSIRSVFGKKNILLSLKQSFIIVSFFMFGQISLKEAIALVGKNLLSFQQYKIFRKKIKNIGNKRNYMSCILTFLIIRLLG